MADRILRIKTVIPDMGKTYRKIFRNAENHEIHLWRIIPDDWIYPHIHPGSDDIWYIIEGEGDYCLSAKKKQRIGPGDIAVASPKEVHGIFNPGRQDIIVLSVLAPLPVDIEEAPGFDYPV